jgi:hypothetical protein
MPDYRRMMLPTTAAAGVATLTGAAVWYLFSSNAVAVTPPAPASRAAAASCAALNRLLPKTVDGQSRRSVDPSSQLTAAWGDPAITLRCGVPEPTVLVPGSPDYDPSADEIYADGVAWLIEPVGSGYRFTAAQRSVYIELDVPPVYQPETDALADLSAAVIAGVPRADGGSGPDTAPVAGGPSAQAAGPSAQAGGAG